MNVASPHLKFGVCAQASSGPSIRPLVATTLTFPLFEGASREFHQYRDAHLGAHDVTNVLDKKDPTMGSHRR